MTWQEVSVFLLRSLIGDDVAPYQYSDARLSSFMLSAAYFVSKEINLLYDYTVDITNETITPDPLDDKTMINLMVLKAWCLLSRSDYSINAPNAVAIKDGPSSIDAKATVEAKKVIMKDACQAFDDAVDDFYIGNARAGEAIIGPHRYLYYGGQHRDRFE